MRGNCDGQGWSKMVEDGQCWSKCSTVVMVNEGQGVRGEVAGRSRRHGDGAAEAGRRGSGTEEKIEGNWTAARSTKAWSKGDNKEEHGKQKSDRRRVSSTGEGWTG